MRSFVMTLVSARLFSSWPLTASCDAATAELKLANCCPEPTVKTAIKSSPAKHNTHECEFAQFQMFAPRPPGQMARHSRSDTRVQEGRPRDNIVSAASAVTKKGP